MNLFGTTGQERRNWLNSQGDAVYNALRYYLGPTGIPDRLVAAGNALAYTDAGDMVEAADASRALWNDPTLANVGRYATAGTAMMVPFVGAKMMADGVDVVGDAIASGSDDAVRFVRGEDGAIRAWHGSPHDFDRFSMDKIGTGEGAQAYGHGLYFAENKGVAQDYRRRLASFKENAEEGVTTVMRYANGDRAKAAELAKQGLETTIRDNFDDGGAQVAKWQEILRLIEDPSVDVTQFKPPGRLYEVSIDANPEDFLDWDAPLSAQPEKVREWFDSRGITPGFAGQQSGNELFQAERRAFGDEAALAESMKEAGLAGVQYLDHGSRFNAMDGLGPQTNTKNYVVFDDKLITILNKYGLAGLLGLGAAGSAMEQPEG